MPTLTLAETLTGSVNTNLRLTIANLERLVEEEIDVEPEERRIYRNAILALRRVKDELHDADMSRRSRKARAE